MDLLTASLLDLLHELEGRGIPITVGGGFGLYLKRQHLASTQQRTLFDQLPEPRSTNDLDLFLRAEVLADLGRTQQVAEAIGRLGYTVVEGAEYLQWKRQIRVAGVPQEVKIDFLVGPLGDYREKLHTKKMPRVRPKESIEFHAHAVEEALHLEDQPIAITLTGNRTTGASLEATVHIPQAFPYLMMKLHAFDDRRGKAEQAQDKTIKEKERVKEQQHAIDLYTIVGMMTEQEYERAKQLGAALAVDEHVRRARMIVWDHFEGSPYGPPVPGAPWTLGSIQKGHYSPGLRGAVGLLRIREHKLFREGFLLREFTSVLEEIFGIGS
jgi:hypothetical protein